MWAMAGLSGSLLVLALNVPQPGKPLSLGQSRMAGHHATSLKEERQE